MNSAKRKRLESKGFKVGIIHDKSIGCHAMNIVIYKDNYDLLNAAANSLAKSFSFLFPKTGLFFS